MAKAAAVEAEFERKTPVEHVLLRPDMYIGSVKPRPGSYWVPKERAAGRGSATCSMEAKDARPVPGLVKLLDEVLVNAMDNHQRDSAGTTRIDVVLDEKHGVVAVRNTGRPVPVQVHAKEKLWVPELVFGHLLTGSNFGGAGSGGAADGPVGVGGRHGYGAKLCNIFSKRFEVLIGDASRGLMYRQRWQGNMGSSTSPQTAAWGDAEDTLVWGAAGDAGAPGGAYSLPAGGAGWLHSEAALAGSLPAPGARAGESFTTVAFEVDVARFGRKDGQGIDRATAAQMRRRVWDAAGLLGSSGVQVTLNGRLLAVPGFREYCGAFSAAEGRGDVLEEAGVEPGRVAHARCGPRWEVGVALASASAGRGGEAVSFVNGVHTPSGGAHVDVVVDELARRLAEAIAPKAKAALAAAAPGGRASATGPAVTAATIRPHLRVFVSARVPEPAFDSQSKDRLTCAATEDGLGSLPVIPARLVKEAAAAGIEAAVLASLRSRQQADTDRAVRKVRTAKRDAAGATARARQAVEVPKLEDAALAGTARSEECALILTEGDSAKALAVAGLAVVGRERFGVFPLRGKLLNVRDAPLKTALENQEVRSVVTALGLDPAKTYAGGAEEARRSLRYGRVIIMADQDHDGSHIKGLVVNMFHALWPSLLGGPAGAGGSFLEAFVTPVIKARRGKSEALEFFSTRAYDDWRASLGARERSAWSVKYYKGLGTSTAEEGRAYFGALDRHRVALEWGGDGDGDRLGMAFAKERADDRKDWLLAAPKRVRSRAALATDANDASDAESDAAEAAPPGSAPLDGRVGSSLSLGSFVDEELIEFSWADVHRSIPSALDGLKPSQRKVLFACMARARGSAEGPEVKVAQLAGAVAEATAYHHGEASLVSAIVNMAQDFVGANNLPLLQPKGQFGTRLAGGKDAASARYIFTALAPTTRLLFPAADDGLLPRCEDDGREVEPVSYAPVVPLVLVNGTAGIGTGWSTSVPKHGPADVAAVVRATLESASDDLLRRSADLGALPYPGAPWASAVSWDAAAADEWTGLARGAVRSLFRGAPWADEGHMLPWWRGFAGTVSLTDAASVETCGLVEGLDYDAYAAASRGKRRAKKAAGDAAVEAAEATVSAASAAGLPAALRVTELPVGRWGDAFKRTLASMVDKGLVDDVLEASTDTAVDITVALTPRGAQEAARLGVERFLRLRSSEGLGNMHLFDPRGRIRRYDSAAAVLGDFMPVRMGLYARRRAAQESSLAADRDEAATRARFIDDVVKGRLKLAGRAAADVEADLASLGFEAAGDDAFDRLLRLPLRELTAENVQRNHKRAADAEAALDEVRRSTPAGLWVRDLEALEAALQPGSGHLQGDRR